MTISGKPFNIDGVIPTASQNLESPILEIIDAGLSGGRVIVPVANHDIFGELVDMVCKIGFQQDISPHHGFDIFLFQVIVKGQGISIDQFGFSQFLTFFMDWEMAQHIHFIMADMDIFRVIKDIKGLIQNRE